ncbi:hypothetical protein EGW08_003745, partial [Elysia chlorotica]
VMDTYDCVVQLFCPPGCSELDLEKRKSSLPGDALWNLLILASKNVLSLSADFKFCKFFSTSHLKPVLDIFLDSLKILSILLKSSHLILDFIKTFKRQSKSLKRVCLYVIRNNDLLYFDEILSVCSGVMGFHQTNGGKKDKIALDAMLSSLEKSSSGEEEDFESSHKHPPMNDKSYSSCDFDLMDDAVLFGTKSPPSNLDSHEGFTKVDLKITNLVEISFCAAVLNHHLIHWLALKDLHLGVPDLQPFMVQGIVSLLKRPQFVSLTLSSAMVTREEMEEILNAVASFRVTHPLERLIFVSVATAISTSLATDVLDDSASIEDAPNMFPKLTDCGKFQGTELLEIYCCGFDLWTEQLFIQFLGQNEALKTLCLGNNLMLSLGKSALRTLTLNDAGQFLHRLILEDWPINSFNCYILRDLLQKVSHSLTSLSLKGCIVDKSEDVIRDIVLGVSACTNLQTLDLSGNYLGNYGALLSGTFMKLTHLKELSLKGNRLPAHIVKSIMTELSESCKQSGTRMKVVDLRVNKFVEDGQETYFEVEKTIRLLQKSFVDKVILDREES